MKPLVQVERRASLLEACDAHGDADVREAPPPPVPTATEQARDRTSCCVVCAERD